MRMHQIIVVADRRAMVNEKNHLENEFSQAEAVLPIQFYGGRRGTRSTEPLRRLMVAMLFDAVRCFQTKFESRQPARQQEFAEVQSWLFSDKDNGPFSFKAVCDGLEIDPQAIRKGLTDWQQQKLSGEKPRMIRRSAAAAAWRISRLSRAKSN